MKILAQSLEDSSSHVRHWAAWAIAEYEKFKHLA
jgi:hypothetical protein